MSIFSIIIVLAYGKIILKGVHHKEKINQSLLSITSPRKINSYLPEVLTNYERFIGLSKECSKQKYPIRYLH